MRIRGVIVLLATLVLVLGALASFSLVLTGKVIEAEEGVSSSVAETSIDENSSVLFEPTLSEISGFKVRFSKQSGILLEWNVSSDASHVVIWRAYSSEGPWFIRKVISTNTLVPRSFYLDRDLMTSTRYYYRMQAINGQELSPFTETRSLYVMHTGDGVETSVSEPDPRYGSPEFWSEYIGECGSSKSVACVSRDREGACIQTSPTYGGECERRLKIYNEFRIGEICRMHPISASRLGCSSLSPRTFSTSGSSGSSGGSGGGNQNDDCFTAEGERNIETDVIECQPQQPPQPLTPPSPNDPSSPGGGSGGGGGGSGNTPTRDYSCHDATARRLIEEGKLPWTPCPKKNETEKNESNQTELNETRSISELLDLWEVEYWENIDKIHSNDNTTLEEKQKESLIAYREWIDKSSNTAIGNRTALYLEGLAYEKLGTELEKQGRLEEAKKAYEKAWEACENAAAGFEIKSETNEYAARACAARNAFRHAALFGPEGGVLDEKYDSRKRSEKLYEELAKDIEAIEDPEIKEKLLPIALEAYVGLAQSKMLGGDIRAADDAIEQLERLAPDHAVTKKVRSIFERALINFIMKTLENGESNANDLLSQKLRTDDGMLSLIAQTGLIDAWDGAQATAADLRNALLGEEFGNKLESLLPLGSVGMSKSDLEIITTAVAQEKFKLTDQEIGLSFMKLALEDGRALKELQGLSVEQISGVFGLDLVACSEEECASALKRAEYIHNKLQNAFENPDVQQYLNDIDGHAFQFENNENYINGDLLAELSGGVSSSDSSSDLYLNNAKKLANDMTSIQGVALGFGPFATLGKLSVSIGSGSRTFTLVGMAEHSLASIVLGSGGSVTSALYKTTKSLFISIDDSAVLTQSVLAAERTHLLTNEMARHSPNAVKEFFSEVAEEVVPEAIGMGANVVAPGSGTIVELIGTAVELAPLTHVGGKARNAGEAAGMAVTSGKSNNRKLGVDFVKTEFFDIEQRKLVTKYVPEFETETRKLDDAVIFYNSENGKTLGKSTRTAFTIHGDPIPIIEFNNQQAFNQYTQNLQAAQNGMYQLNDGSYVIVYVKGNLPSVLPDVKANNLLINGGKGGDSLMMIGEPVDDASLSFISTGLIEEDTRLYSRSEVEDVFLYLPPVDSRISIVGVTPNSLFVQKANAEIDALVAAGVIRVKKGERAPFTDIECSGKCNFFSPTGKAIITKVKQDIASNPEDFSVNREVRVAIEQVTDLEVKKELQFLLDQLDALGVPLYVHPEIKKTNSDAFISGKGIVLSHTDFPHFFQYLVHEADHALYSDLWRREVHPQKSQIGVSGTTFNDAWGDFQQESKDQRIFMFYDPASKRLYFTHAFTEPPSLMVPVEVSVKTAFEYNAFVRQLDIADRLKGKKTLADAGSDLQGKVLVKFFNTIGKDYEYDSNIRFLDSEEIVFLRHFQDPLYREMFYSRNDRPIDLAQKVDALRHIELSGQLEIPGQISSGAASTVRKVLVEQLAPQRALLSQDQMQVLERAARQSGVVIDLVPQQHLIPKPTEPVFTIQRRDTIIGMKANAATRITRENVGDIFANAYNENLGWYGTKAVVYRDRAETYHVRFWDSGDGSPRDLHHQDGLADLLYQEAEGLEKLAYAKNDEALFNEAIETEQLAQSLNALRHAPFEIYPEDVLLRAEGFQLTRDKSGKIVAFDVDSGITFAQIKHSSILDAAELSEMISRVHESIDPSLRGYTYVRVEGLQNIKINGEVKLPDGLEIVELQENLLH